MTVSIIRSGDPASLPYDITRTEEIDHDCYRGPLKSMLASGVIRADQLPQLGKASIAYFQGEVVFRKCKRDETYLRIMVYADSTTAVLVGVSHKVAGPRRIAAAQAHAKEMAEHRDEAKKREQMKDPGWDAFVKALPPSPARFNVGDLCMHISGHHMEISGDYALHKVMRKEGRYMDDAGETFDYAYGYTARELGCREFFFEAGELLGAEGYVKHLQLV